jgi:hypothetical protein
MTESDWSTVATVLCFRLPNLRQRSHATPIIVRAARSGPIMIPTRLAGGKPPLVVASVVAGTFGASVTTRVTVCCATTPETDEVVSPSAKTVCKTVTITDTMELEIVVVLVSVKMAVAGTVLTQPPSAAQE